MKTRSLVRTSLTVLAAPFVVVLYLNIETYAQSKGWDTLLKGAMEGKLPAVVDWALQPWVGLTGLALISFTLGLWFDAVLRRRERKAPPPVGAKVIYPEGEDPKENAQRAIADLYAIGVATRNRLVRPISDYNQENEAFQLEKWQQCVLSRMEEARVPIAAQSRFRTLNQFVRAYPFAEGRGPEQMFILN